MRFWKCLEPAPAPALALDDPDTCDKCHLPQTDSDYTYIITNEDDVDVCIRCCFKDGTVLRDVSRRRGYGESGRWGKINIERLQGTAQGDPLPYDNDETESINIFNKIFKGEKGPEARQVQYDELIGLLDTSPLKLKSLLEAATAVDPEGVGELLGGVDGLLALATRAATEEQIRRQLNRNRITDWINDPTEADDPQGGGYKKKKRKSKKRRLTKKNKKSKKKRKSKRRK